MAADQIDDQLQAPAVGFGQQAVECLKRPHARIDRPVVADVVAEVLQRRCEERRYPDGIDAKRRNMIQPLNYSIQIAVTIGITIGKAKRIYLV